jgi:hypothetical protein
MENMVPYCEISMYVCMYVCMYVHTYIHTLCITISQIFHRYSHIVKNLRNIVTHHKYFANMLPLCWYPHMVPYFP